MTIPMAAGMLQCLTGSGAIHHIKNNPTNGCEYVVTPIGSGAICFIKVEHSNTCRYVAVPSGPGVIDNIKNDPTIGCECVAGHGAEATGSDPAKFNAFNDSGACNIKDPLIDQLSEQDFPKLCESFSRIIFRCASRMLRCAVLPGK